MIDMEKSMHYQYYRDVQENYKIVCKDYERQREKLLDAIILWQQERMRANERLKIINKYLCEIGGFMSAYDKNLSEAFVNIPHAEQIISDDKSQATSSLILAMEQCGEAILLFEKRRDIIGEMIFKVFVIYKELHARGIKSYDSFMPEDKVMIQNLLNGSRALKKQLEETAYDKWW